METRPPLRVVVAGGGIAGLEAILSLRELAGDRVSLTVLEPRPHLRIRALELGEAFGTGRAGRLSIEEVAAAAGARLVGAKIDRVDTATRRVHTTDGGSHDYDALLIAVGARATVAFRDALTWLPGGRHEDFGELLAEVRDGVVRRIAFVVPARCPWPLPAYELALMVAHRFDTGEPRPELSLITPEAAPLAVFGAAGSAAVSRELRAAGIRFAGNAVAAVRRNGEVVVDVWPGGRRFAVDRVVALPHAVGPDIPGLRADIEGFLVTDDHCAVRGAERVWAAGDATSRVPTNGGLAARQADCIAQQIARLAGARVATGPYVPLLRAQLRTGRGSLWLQRDISEPRDAGTVGHVPLWSPPGKIAARRLGSVLAAHEVPGGLRIGSVA